MGEIYRSRGRVADGFLRTSSDEKRAMKHGELHFAGVIGNGNREKAGILVVHVDEIDIVIRSKGREPESFPVQQIFRNSQCDPRADG